MPKRLFELTKEISDFIDTAVRAGDYRDADEAIRAAVEALRRERQEAAEKMEKLRAEIQLGIDDLENGRFVEVDDRDLDAFLDRLAPKSKAVSTTR